jgi:hypothetical protein
LKTETFRMRKVERVETMMELREDIVMASMDAVLAA